MMGKMRLVVAVVGTAAAGVLATAVPAAAWGAPFVTDCVTTGYMIPMACDQTTATSGGPPRWGNACNDVNRLAYDDTDVGTIIGTILCDGRAWIRMGQGPIGVHKTGSSCDEPGVQPFEYSASEDGHLIVCNWMQPAETRTWTPYKPKWSDYPS